MIQESADQFALLTAIHASIDKMVEGLSDEQWLKKPGDGYNNVASILDHVCRVEQKFFAALAGENVDIDTQAPFKAASWDLAAIRTAWQDSLSRAQSALAGLTEASMGEPGMKLGIGDLNKRQLISYAIAHTAHHRGQIPIVKKLIGAV
ncbi:DinB family protein [Alicyclobacillus tolerans]|uniref:DinB family protein n=1 Tax=Alicyclobacillus tolerans TaxID=90970 RepID=UPI001F443FD9|nr:DinB family protein [Alicyclobacillus tolerans]MCF8566130.1 DinB family protein [Alicyclobacillus tolerans]